MSPVRPKKHLGQHFLHSQPVARRIVSSLTGHGNYENLLEIGPGTGVLSKILWEHEEYNWWGMDVDEESVTFLKNIAPENQTEKILEQDFLTTDLFQLFQGSKVAIIGNFPYNISSQILFKILEFRDVVPEMVGMFQKEVAKRVVAGPGGKVNGILSVLCQAYYDVEYLFGVDENVFVPPPKVKSAVIRMKRNAMVKLPCDEKKFFSIVKTAFNQRRKTLRNALKTRQIDWSMSDVDLLASKRAEQLTTNDFINIVLACKE